MEWAAYGDNLYGTLKSEIVAAREAGKDALLEIEVKGSLQIRDQAQDLAPARSLLIFILPPSFATLGETSSPQTDRIGKGTETTFGHR